MIYTALQHGDFHMPAEWESHEATWLSWPYDTTTFPYLKEVEDAYKEFIKLILPYEKINLLVKDKEMKKRVFDIFKNSGSHLKNLLLHKMDYKDVWIRDYGPIFVVNKNATKLAITKWEFNAWGNKYPELLEDNDIPYRINKELNLKCFFPGIILEGGSIDVNGKGSLITTSQCLLNKNRNKKLSKNEIEKKLKDFLGINNIIWLKNGLEGDDTDGHVDDIARFVNPTTILCAYEKDKKDKNYKSLEYNYKFLENHTLENGKKINIFKLPMPKAIWDGKRRLPASYMNFYISNNVVVCPIFGEKTDEEVLKILESFFPDRKVIGVFAKHFVYGNGAFHCATQQQPKINH